ncbi:MAG: PaaI family thioesterase [Pseudomonadota bacterium]
MIEVNPDLSPDVAERIAASFDRQTLMTTLGARLTALGQGHCQIEAPLHPGGLQQQGFAHAGVTFALGDSAAGYAALTHVPPPEEIVTVEMKINLLAPALGPTLMAVGRVVRAGRRVLVVQADVYAGPDQRHVALMQGTMMPVPSGG